MNFLNGINGSELLPESVYGPVCFLTGSSRARNWLWAYAVIQVSLLACRGFLGGVLAHG